MHNKRLQVKRKRLLWKGTNPTPEESNYIKTLCSESDDSLKRAHDKQLPSTGEDDMTLYEDCNFTHNTDKNSHSALKGAQQNSVHTPRYGGPTNLTCKRGLKNLERDNIKCVPTFILDSKSKRGKIERHRIIIYRFGIPSEFKLNGRNRRKYVFSAQPIIH